MIIEQNRFLCFHRFIFFIKYYSFNKKFQQHNFINHFPFGLFLNHLKYKYLKTVFILIIKWEQPSQNLIINTKSSIQLSKMLNSSQMINSKFKYVQPLMITILGKTILKKLISPIKKISYFLSTIPSKKKVGALKIPAMQK